jgi:hypothetical protein
LGLGAAGYAGTKLAQKAFGDGIKKKQKTGSASSESKTKAKTYGQGIKLIGNRV